VREAVGPEITVVAGVGTYDTAHSIDLAREHAKLGLDGLLVVTPYYSKPSQAGVIAHTTAVADSTDLPVMLYDIPGRSGIPLSYETLLRLGENPRIVAVKDAKGDLHQASRVMAATDLVYYCGEDALNLPWLSIGAAGIVSVVSQVSGELEKAMIEAVDRSDLPAAREANRRLVPLVEAIMAHMPGAVAAKAALHLQGVLPHAAMRGPHVAADAHQLRMLTPVLAPAGLLCPARRPDRPPRSCWEVLMSTVFSQRLPQPPPLPEGTLRIVPLGGLGDVGRNMTVLEFEGRLLIVDCGVL